MPIFGKEAKDGSDVLLSGTMWIGGFGSGTNVIAKSVPGVDIPSDAARHLNDSSSILDKCHFGTSLNGKTPWASRYALEDRGSICSVASALYD